MDRRNRAVHRQRIRARSRPEDDGGRYPIPEPSQPRDPLIQVDVTFTLSRGLVWLLAGIAIGNVRLPDGFLEKVCLILRALLSG